MKILFILQTPWGTHYGMSKVHHDLKVEYERLGHEVEYLDWKKLYPKGPNFYTNVFGELYPQKILAYLKENAHKYDVIDANYYCIPYPKKSYNYKGVVVCRSHGLQPLYEQVEQSASYKKMYYSSTVRPNISLKTRVGNLKRFFEKRHSDYELFGSISNADIVHALNYAERDYFISYGVPEKKVVLVPNGVPDDRVNLLRENNSIIKNNEISFVGAWTIRKGIKDLNSIIHEVAQGTTIKKINLLGGGSNDRVTDYFAEQFHSLICSKSHFSQNELPELLKSTKVGIFPSYVEGLPLAVLEQLALGIPVVAYDIPALADVLGPLNEKLLIRVGDTKAFGDKIVEIMSLDEDSYHKLVVKCQKHIETFKISKIAKQFLRIYQEAM